MAEDDRAEGVVVVDVLVAVGIPDARPLRADEHARWVHAREDSRTRRRGYFGRHAPPARPSESAGGRDSRRAAGLATPVRTLSTIYDWVRRSSIERTRRPESRHGGHDRAAGRDHGFGAAARARNRAAASARRDRGRGPGRHRRRRDRGRRRRRAGRDRRASSRCGRPRSRRLRATGLLIRAGIGYDIIDVAAATERGHLGRQRARLLRRRGRRPRGAAPDVGLAAAVRARARLARGEVGQSADHAAGPSDPWAGASASSASGGSGARSASGPAASAGRSSAYDPFLPADAVRAAGRRADRSRRAVLDVRCGLAPLTADARRRVTSCGGAAGGRQAPGSCS